MKIKKAIAGSILVIAATTGIMWYRLEQIKSTSTIEAIGLWYPKPAAAEAKSGAVKQEEAELKLETEGATLTLGKSGQIAIPAENSIAVIDLPNGVRSFHIEMERQRAEVELNGNLYRMYIERFPDGAYDLGPIEWKSETGEKRILQVKSLTEEEAVIIYRDIKNEEEASLAVADIGNLARGVKQSERLVIRVNGHEIAAGEIASIDSSGEIVFENGAQLYISRCEAKEQGNLKKIYGEEVLNEWCSTSKIKMGEGRSVAVRIESGNRYTMICPESELEKQTAKLKLYAGAETEADEKTTTNWKE